MGIFEAILALFKQDNEKKQYYQNKKETEETAVADTVFWDKSENVDKKELSKRKKFLKLWNDIYKQIPEVIPTSFDKDKSKNINIILTNLRLANIEYYTYKNLTKLRNCRFIEGNIQMLYGTIQQATNCFMQVLYLDIIDDVMNKLEPVIAPKIYKWAFQENLPMDKFEKIFKFNAESIIKSLKFEVSVSPDKAWNKIVEYSNVKNNTDV